MTFASLSGLSLMGLNRYMVECKFLKMPIANNVDLRLNRYMVECKYERDVEAVKDCVGLNRYMVECKLFCRYSVFINFIAFK